MTGLLSPATAELLALYLVAVLISMGVFLYVLLRLSRRAAR